jgi:hypothetical protein
MRSQGAKTMTPLYGHNSFETAYLVDSYPYGRLRCRIWFWLESDPKKGFRFVSQTENPKNGRMNAPKKSTYSKMAGCMFLDENLHCTWTGITEYSDCGEALAFVQKFQKSDLLTLKVWSYAKARYCNQILLSGKNLQESDTERYQIDYKGWSKVNLACQSTKVEVTDNTMS